MARHGENIRKRKDGRWEARYIQGYRTDGKAMYRSVYGRTYQEAKRKRQICMTRRGQQTAATKNCTFGEAAQMWLEERQTMVKPSTYGTYRNVVRNHLVPELGPLPLKELTSEKVSGFLTGQLNHGRLDGGGGLSAKTVTEMRNILKLILEYARFRGYLCTAELHVRLPERRTTPARVLSRAEQFALEHILFAQQTPLNLGVLMSLYAGLRIGEVCALQWGDICLEEGTVFVHKTVIRIQEPCQDAGPRTRLMVTEPKTPCSRRVIPLPDFLLRYLAGAKQNEKDYLASGRSAPLEPRTCLSQYKRLLKKAGVEDTTFHTLRHTFATRCIESGMDVKSLSEIMGHSGVSITMQRYVHPSMDAKREQINRLVPLPIHGQNSGQQQSLNA